MRGLTVFFFAINVGLFFFVLTCTISRYIMFPDVRLLLWFISFYLFIDTSLRSFLR